MSNSKYIQLSEEMNDGIKILGDTWILSIIGALSNQSMRFNEIQRTVSDICPATLTNRLKILENEKIIIRQEEIIDRQSVTYSLTKKGKDILPALNEIQIFASKYLKNQK